jgi:hypothetical protein
MGEFIVARYLFDQRPDGRYVPKVSIWRHGRPEIVITDPEGRTYRNLNRALAMDFWRLTHWRTKHAPKLGVVVQPAEGQARSVGPP